MMKKLLMTLSLLLTLGLLTAGVAAQDDAPDSEAFDDSDYSSIEGLLSSYDRTYTVDFEATLASPEADFEDMDMAAMMRLIGIEGLTFDSEDNAQAYLQQTLDEFDSEAPDDEELLDEVEITELDGFDVDGMRMIMEFPEPEMAVLVVIFVDGNHVFQVAVIDAEMGAAESKLDEVIQFVLDAEVESDEVAFNMDGSSTGGVFDRMPSVGHEIVGDLSSVSDTELFADGGE